MSRDPSHEKAEIFRIYAQRLFGLLLSLLCEEANISQNRLGRKAAAYRRYLVSNGYMLSESEAGTIDQSGISRVIIGEKPPSYAQTYIWLHLLREIFESKDYRNICTKTHKTAYEFTEELEIDMWRLSMCGTPDEVVLAYHKHKSMLKED